MLRSIPVESKQEAIVLLSFLTWSNHPLSLHEAVDAIAVDLEEDPAFDPMRRMPILEEILRICPSLVTISKDPKGKNLLQLAHFSVKEYLTSKDLKVLDGMLGESKSRTRILDTCLAYMSSVDRFEDLGADIFPNINTEGEPDKLAKTFPMATYCAAYWVDHAKLAERADHGIARSISTFVTRISQKEWSCCLVASPEFPFNMDTLSGTPLLIAVNLGLSFCVKCLFGRWC